MASTGVTDTSIPTIMPQAGQTYADPAMEMATRNILASYFGTGQPGDLGLMGQPIPIPIQQVAGLSPLEVQARNAAQGLGGFGGQLAEAQDLFRQSGQGFDPRSAGLFADPRARALYEQSLGQYDPSMGERFVDPIARSMMEGAAGDIGAAGASIPEQIAAAQRGMAGGSRDIESAALRAMDATGQANRATRQASQQAQLASTAGEEALLRGAGRVGGVVGAGQQGLSQALAAGQAAASRAGAGIEDAARGITGQGGGAQTGAEEATRRAREQTQMAGTDLRSAGQMGRAAALQGIAGLAGTGDQFDPAGIARFQDPFNQQVIEAQQEEIARLGEKQKQDARAQQIRAGAFGGSRGAIQEAEIGRNVLQQQAKTGAELRSQGFQQAASQAQQAFEQAQARRQQAAQLTGSLGQAGAGTSLQAAGRAGELGLTAEQLAQRGALEGGQLGLSGQQGIGSLLGQAGQFGMQAAEMGRGVAGEQAALGMQGIQSEADLANRAAQMGISTQQLRSQLAQQAGQAGRDVAQMGMQAGRDVSNIAQQSGQLGMQGAQAQAGLAGQRADIAQGMGQMGMAGQQLGANVFGQQMDRTAQAAQGLGGLTQNQFGTALQAFGAGTGAQRAAASGIAGLGQQGQQMLGTQISTLGQLGTQGRGIQQAGLDAQYKAGTQLADEPFMRLQRGQALLQGGAPFMPQYTSGFGMGQNQGQAQTRGSTLAQGLAAAGTVASFFPKSDIRLKENVMKVDDVQPGVGWYTWDWNDTAKAMGIDDPTEGVIAQELKAVDPSAVIIGDDGYYSVDYSKVSRSREAI